MDCVSTELVGAEPYAPTWDAFLCRVEDLTISVYWLYDNHPFAKATSTAQLAAGACNYHRFCSPLHKTPDCEGIMRMVGSHPWNGLGSHRRRAWSSKKTNKQNTGIEGRDLLPARTELSIVLIPRVTSRTLILCVGAGTGSSRRIRPA